MSIIKKKKTKTKGKKTKTNYTQKYLFWIHCIPFQFCSSNHRRDHVRSFLLEAIKSKTIKCKACFRFLLRLLLSHSGMGSASSQLKLVVLN